MPLDAGSLALDVFGGGMAFKAAARAGKSAASWAMLSADTAAQGSRWAGRFGEYAAGAARRSKLWNNGALAENWSTMEFGFFQQGQAFAKVLASC